MRVILSLLLGVVMAGLGWIIAKADIWFYSLGSSQSRLLLIVAPLILGLMGLLFGLTRK